MAPIATTFSWRDQRPHMRPFLVGQIAGITQQASVVTPAILVRPHRRPPESGRSLESQTVPMNQIVLGRALRKSLDTARQQEARLFECRSATALARAMAEHDEHRAHDI